MFRKHATRILFCSLYAIIVPTHASYLDAEFVSFSFNEDHFVPEDNSQHTAADEKNFFNFSSSSVTARVHTPQATQEPPAKVRLGLQYALNYLARTNSNRTVAPYGVKIKNRQLADTAKALINWRGRFTPNALKNNFHLMELDQRSSASSKFTGYYTPVISAKLHRDHEYRYPIYRSPITTPYRLSRSQISSGALANKGLEIAWTNDPVGLFYIHIQGSGVLKLPNGERVSLKFDGSNEKPFRSIAKYMQSRGLLRGNPSRDVIQKWLLSHPNSMQEILNTNPRYIYFTLDKGDVLTASGVPVIPGHTVAVDTRYIPFGAVILAEVPIINNLGRAVGSEWRILFSQDRGNAIKGPAHIDIYTGVGESARKMANNLTGYGKTYLLLKQPFNNTLASTSTSLY